MAFFHQQPASAAACATGPNTSSAAPPRYLQMAASDYNEATLSTNYDSLNLDQTSCKGDASSKKLHDSTLAQLDVAGKVILEIGSAGGEALRSFEGRGAAELIGVDQNELFLDIARASAGPTPSRFIAADMHVLPLDTNSVDIIVSKYTFHYTEDVQGLVRELCRVLRPGGQLLAVFNAVEMKSSSPYLEAPVSLNRWYPVFLDCGERQFTAKNCASTSQEWRDALAACGFAITFSQQLDGNDKWDNEVVQYQHHRPADLFTQTLHARFMGTCQCKRG